MVLNELRVMRGPNMWADNFRKLIVLKLDYSDYSDSVIKNISEHIHNNLHLNINSTNSENPLLLLTNLIARLGITIQPEVNSVYSDAKLIGSGSYYAIFSYEEEEVGMEAAHIACNIIEAVIQDKTPVSIDLARKRLKRIYTKLIEGPSTSTIIKAAEKRNIPVKKIAGGFISFGQGKYQKRISASIAETTGYISVEIAGDKDITKRLLSQALIPVPEGFLIRNEKSLREVSEELGFPLVIKPWNANKGKGVTSNITNAGALHRAYTLASAYSKPVIIERHILGYDFRFLVIGYKLVAVAKRTPACVKGDGTSTIRELIDLVNSDPLRGEGHGKTLTKIVADEFTLHILASKNMSLNTVIRKDECVFLKDTANLSTGGTAEDVTDDVHPENILLAQRVAKIIGLDICGIDIIAPDIKTPITLNGGAVLEVNAAPGLRMHISPSSGKPRDVGNPIMNLVYPENARTRIPVVAITGTNGKTTTTRLMAFIAGNAGHSVGFTTTDGIYLNETQLSKGDCTGSNSAKIVLQEPSVDFAVLECARGGIIRSGLGFDQCDIGIVTNIAEDHLGLKDIYTLEDLANVKLVVPQSVKPDGYALLNASDDFVYKMKDKVRCNIGLFSIDNKNPRIKEHCNNGGVAITVDENKNIVIQKKNENIVIENVVNIPLTIEGKADFMIENVLAAVLASYLLGFSIRKIKTSLISFKPSVEQTPGRLNKFEINNVNVIIDYAHNPHGLKAMGGFLTHINEPKVGIITGVGDRRDSDIIQVGKIAAEIYDEVIIRIDKDTRGRTPDEIADLVIQGLKQVNEKIKYHLIPDSKNALKFAIENSKKGTYIIISADNVWETINIMKELECEYKHK